MVAAAKDSELIEIIDHMLAEVRERVLSTPFRARTAPEMWRAAETARGAGANGRHSRSSKGGWQSPAARDPGGS